MATDAKLSDCPLILLFLESKQDVMAQLGGGPIGNEFTPEEQKAILEFLESLTDEQLAYVIKTAYLLRDI